MKRPVIASLFICLAFAAIALYASYRIDFHTERRPSREEIHKNLSSPQMTVVPVDLVADGSESATISAESQASDSSATEELLLDTGETSP